MSDTKLSRVMLNHADDVAVSSPRLADELRYYAGKVAALESRQGEAVNLTDEFDARVWAREFVRLNSASDEAMMLAWFANALMAGYDHARRATPPTAGEGDNYVAWLRHKHHDDGKVTIHLCDSDSPGAFKVYRHAAPPATVSEEMVSMALMRLDGIDFTALKEPHHHAAARIYVRAALTAALAGKAPESALARAAREDNELMDELDAALAGKEGE